MAFPLYIAENFKYDILLGTDFVIQANATIDFVNLVARMGTLNVKISVGPITDVFESRRTSVNLLETVKTPAHCEVIVKENYVKSMVGLKTKSVF